MSSNLDPNACANRPALTDTDIRLKQLQDRIIELEFERSVLMSGLGMTQADMDGLIAMLKLDLEHREEMEGLNGASA